MSNLKKKLNSKKVTHKYNYFVYYADECTKRINIGFFNISSFQKILDFVKKLKTSKQSFSQWYLKWYQNVSKFIQCIKHEAMSHTHP